MARTGIIFGGRSGEHEVSLMSAASVIKALSGGRFELVFLGITKKGQWKLFHGLAEDIESGRWEEEAAPFNPGDLKGTVDFAFPVLHGPYGEDGTIQGLFEMLDVPYAGCGVLASALAMDKLAAKEIFSHRGLTVCRYVPVMAEELAGGIAQVAGKVEEGLSGKYPMFVKPANMGSSVGVSKVKDRTELEAAIVEAAKHDRRLIIEEGIDARELETAVLGNADPAASSVGEILPSSEFYDYRAKYFDGGETKIIVPANIEKNIADQIREAAVEAYKALDCTGFSRVDFLVEKGTDRVYLSEINTIPGFTKFSMFPLLWQDAGLTYYGLLERIVDLGYERYYAKDRRNTDVL